MKKVVLITGGARGIGKKVAEILGKLGYCIVVNYNTSEAKAKALEKAFKANNIDSLFIKADISNETQVKSMVETVIKKYGRIDVLINNSAITNDSLFQDKTAKSFLKVLEVNLIGAFNVSKLVGNIMFRNKYGKIVNISSTNGINTYYPMCLEYDASKAGLISLTHNLAVQFAPYVNVNAIAPGFIATESELDGVDEDFLKLESDKVLLKRAGKEEDVANLVKFLISDDASYINNEVIRIDGGLYGNY